MRSRLQRVSFFRVSRPSRSATAIVVGTAESAGFKTFPEVARRTQSRCTIAVPWTIAAPRPERSSRRPIGDEMPDRAVFALLTLVSVVACQQPTSPGPAPEYRPEDAGTVDHALCLLGFAAVTLREVASGHHLVEATINGRVGSFVLDTGANVTVVDRQHLGHFGIESRGARGAVVGGLGGGQRATQVSIKSLRIGDIDVRQQRIVSADLGQLLGALGQATGTIVYGLVGQDVLKEHRGIVDVAAPRLYLMVEDRDPAPVPAQRCSEAPEPDQGGSEHGNGVLTKPRAVSPTI